MAALSPRWRCSIHPHHTSADCIPEATRSGNQRRGVDLDPLTRQQRLVDRRRKGDPALRSEVASWMAGQRQSLEAMAADEHGSGTDEEATVAASAAARISALICEAEGDAPLPEDGAAAAAPAAQTATVDALPAAVSSRAAAGAAAGPPAAEVAAGPAPLTPSRQPSGSSAAAEADAKLAGKQGYVIASLPPKPAAAGAGGKQPWWQASPPSGLPSIPEVTESDEDNETPPSPGTPMQAARRLPLVLMVSFVHRSSLIIMWPGHTFCPFPFGAGCGTACLFGP